MVETFTWQTERGVQPKIEYKTITAQFGDGYAQTSTDGINNKDESYSVKVHAYGQRAVDIQDFFDRHAGWKSFFWTPPLGKLGLYRCLDATPVAQGGGLYVFSGTFIKSYSAPE